MIDLDVWLSQNTRPGPDDPNKCRSAREISHAYLKANGQPFEDARVRSLVGELRRRGHVHTPGTEARTNLLLEMT